MSEDCSTKYICSKSGEGKVERMSCHADETCGLRNGKRGCYPKQCILGAEGAFTTFEGKSGRVDQNGIYDLVKVCEDTVEEGWFRIAMNLQLCPKRGKMAAAGIVAFFDNLSIIINSKFETWVSPIP